MRTFILTLIILLALNLHANEHTPDINSTKEEMSKFIEDQLTAIKKAATYEKKYKILSDLNFFMATTGKVLRNYETNLLDEQESLKEDSKVTEATAGVNKINPESIKRDLDANLLESERVDKVLREFDFYDAGLERILAMYFGDSNDPTRPTCATIEHDLDSVHAEATKTKDLMSKLKAIAHDMCELQR